jgi:hypothetical protein
MWLKKERKKERNISRTHLQGLGETTIKLARTTGFAFMVQTASSQRLATQVACLFYVTPFHSYISSDVEAGCMTGPPMWSWQWVSDQQCLRKNVFMGGVLFTFHHTNVHRGDVTRRPSPLITFHYSFRIRGIDILLLCKSLSCFADVLTSYDLVEELEPQEHK